MDYQLSFNQIKLNYRTHDMSLQNKEDYLLRLDKHPRSECTCDEVEFNCTYSPQVSKQLPNFFNRKTL